MRPVAQMRWRAALVFCNHKKREHNDKPNKHPSGIIDGQETQQMFWRDPHYHNIGCYAPIEDLAKVKTLIKGRLVPNKYATNGKAVKEFSKMTVVDFYNLCVHEAVKDVVADEESREWAARMIEKHMKDYDVDPGLYQKQRKKTGRKTSQKRKKTNRTKQEER